MRRLMPITVIATLLAAACATAFNGTQQQIQLSSMPSNAKVTIDSVEVGNTPIFTSLARRSSHAVRIELAGFQPFDVTLSRRPSGWAITNLAFGIGAVVTLAIDAVSGGLFYLTPDQLSAQLIQQGASANGSPSGIVVVLVPNGDPSWTRVGQLLRQTGR